MSAPNPALARLERHWARLAALGGAVVIGASVLIQIHYGPAAAFRWGVPVAAVLAWFFLQLRRSLDLNHPPDDPALRPRLGAANLVTVARAGLTASLAGFLLPGTADTGGGACSWLPGLIYLSAVAMDAVDGHIARRTRNLTRLGAHLDTQVDAFGLLLSGLLLTASAKAPWSFLAVGSGFYVLKAAIGLRRRSGLPVGRVAPRPGARWVAGCEMTFAALALLPVFGPEATRPAAWVMTLAMVSSLSLDWCIVCGHCAEDGRVLARLPALLGSALSRWGPLMLRAATAAGWALLLSAPSPGSWEDADPIFKKMAAAGVLLCLSGVAARAAAMLLNLLGALWLVPSMPGSAASATLMATIALMLTGAGHPRLWQPEDAFLMRRGAAPGAPPPCGE